MHETLMYTHVYLLFVLLNIIVRDRCSEYRINISRQSVSDVVRPMSKFRTLKVSFAIQNASLYLSSTLVSFFFCFCFLKLILYCVLTSRIYE